MTEHKFRIGQEVVYNPPRRLPHALALYKVVRLLPTEDGELKYRIKAGQESFERVAKESELTQSS